MVKDKRNIYIVIMSILGILGVFLVYQYSYGKYAKSLSGNIDADVAKWKILVNNEDVINNKTLRNKIKAVFPGNEYISSGVIAPGATGYFDIVINPSNVDVAFRYDIDFNDNTEYPDIKVTKYVVNPTSGKETTFNGTITGTVKPKSTAFTVRVYIEWYDESDNKMNNSTDTKVVQDNTSLDYNVNLKFTQVKG